MTDQSSMSPRRRVRRPVIALDTQVAEIVEALTALGGEAHRSLVLQQIAIARFGRPAKVTPRLEQDVIAAFEAHLRLPADVPAKVTGRFGAGSHRWALASRPAAAAPTAAHADADAVWSSRTAH